MTMTNEMAKALLESLKPIQKDPGPEGYPFPCARCGRNKMDAENSARNAMSRYADVYICGECSREEAIRAAAGLTPLPFKQWAMARDYGGK